MMKRSVAWLAAGNILLLTASSLVVTSGFFLAPVTAQPTLPGLRQHVACQPGVLTSAEAPLQAPKAHIPRADSIWHFADGGGVKVAVIDTGVAAHHRLNEVIDAGDLVADDSALSDCDGHGTVVAGIIAAQPHPADKVAGIAPRATILSIRQSSAHFHSNSTQNDDRTADSDAATSSGVGTLTTLALAIDRAREQGAHIINMSVVACAPPGQLPGGGQALHAAVDKAEAAGIVLVAAAGNSSHSCTDGAVAWPAALPTVLAVAAEAEPHSPAEYSVSGPWVDIAAPGGPVVGLAPSGTGLIDAAVTQNGHFPLLGTSFAAPVVSGTAALLRQMHPDWTAEQIRQRILSTASPASPAAGMGIGVVDPVAAVLAPVEGTGGAYGTSQAAVRKIHQPQTSPAEDPRGLRRFAAVSVAAGFALLCAIALAGLPAVRRQLD